MKLVIMAVMASGLLMGCSGDDQDDLTPVPEVSPTTQSGEAITILHRHGYDITMADFRTALRTDMAADPMKWRLTCELAAGKPAGDAWTAIAGLDLFGPLGGPDDGIVLPEGATEVPGQEEILLTGISATQLVVEECAAAFPYYRR